MRFQLKFPDNFLLLRGNHETPIVNRIYGFYEDLVRRFGTPRLYNVFQVRLGRDTQSFFASSLIQEVFAVMPLSALVADRILCMHGGLSPSLLTAPSIAILNEIKRPILVRFFTFTVEISHHADEVELAGSTQPVLTTRPTLGRSRHQREAVQIQYTVRVPNRVKSHPKINSGRQNIG